MNTTIKNNERTFLLNGDMGKSFVCNIEDFKKCWDEYEDKDNITVAHKWNGRFVKCSKKSIIDMMKAFSIDYSFLSNKPMTYKIVFNGRKLGAIGIFQDFKTTVKAFTREQASNKLYDNFEHITKVKFLN